VLHARGTVDGTPAVAFATDATRMGGAIGVRGCRRVVEAIDVAVRDRVPVAGLWHSGGARIAEGVAALDAAGQVFAAMVRASGRIPQISVVLGPAAGSAAYSPALTDLVIMSRGGRLVPSGTATSFAHVTTEDEPAALAEARRLIRLLGQQGRLSPSDVRPGRLDTLIQDQNYDVRPLVRALLDAPGVESHAPWAPNVVTTLGRFAGRTVGVIANNPQHLNGCLDASGAEKAARFVRMCDALAVPLIVVVDTPGYLPGHEPDAVVRRGAQLVHAFAAAVVPRVTLVTRRAYGGGYLAMNSRALGASAVFAWPQAELTVLDPGAAVHVLHRRQLADAAPEHRDALRERLIRERTAAAGGVQPALEAGVVDAVIQPEETRRRIAEALAAAPPARGAHSNIPL
jgi:acetyl-CoA/propionyl-CoA carboxylase carboxyl transferase subunit